MNAKDRCFQTAPAEMNSSTKIIHSNIYLPSALSPPNQVMSRAGDKRVLQTHEHICLEAVT